MNTHTFTVALRRGPAGRRTRLLLCGAGAVAIAATALGSPASAISGVTGTGSTTCSSGWTGTMTFNPPLTASGTAGTVGVGIQASFTGCTGGTPTPTGGTYVAKGVVKEPSANNCANWFAAPLVTPPQVPFNAAHLDGVVNWTPSGSINPSNASFTTMRIWTGSAGRLIIHLPAPAASLVTGSYAPTADLLLRTGVFVTAVATACSSSAGLASLPIVPAAPSAVFSTGTW